MLCKIVVNSEFSMSHILMKCQKFYMDIVLCHSKKQQLDSIV